ncbi:hypothetical protein ACIQU6_18610 [Streptomyces sp. NPDC090442]|uniref:hypothetical protein n=1 Tax=Streptomyces sp. NPDC090442 TaxID=3365962 RepID=UPI0038142529
MSRNHDSAAPSRILTEDEYEQAYSRLASAARRQGSWLGADAAHQALAEALAAIGVAVPTPEPEADTCTSPRTADVVTWLLPGDEEARHGGFVLGRLDDGTVPTHRSGRALYERQFADSSTGQGGTWSGPAQGAPSKAPTALIPACACGWRGADLPYHPAGGVCGDGTCHDGQAVSAHRAWQSHATAALSAVVPDGCRDRLAALTTALGELADHQPRAALAVSRQLREIAGLIEPLAVAEALAHSVPWETIGTDLGQTKQAVNRRYTNPSRTLSTRVEQIAGTNVETLLTTARNRAPGTRLPGIDWASAARRVMDSNSPSDPAT